MTDKQIIIDGEQCEYLSDIGLCRLTYYFTGKSYDCSMCKDNPNCHYKNWQRKEQECEELKSVRDSWISKCEQETKIKELYQDGLDQLKQAIEKIKELIQKEINDCEHRDDCTSCEYNCCIRQAMQICNEVASE